MACNSNPWLSTRTCRFLPLTFLPASHGSGCAGPRAGYAMRVNVSTALFRVLDALGVDDRRGRAGLPRGVLPAFEVERMVDALQRSVPTPAVEVAIQRAACR